MSKIKDRLKRTTYKSMRVDICLDGELRDERDRRIADVRAAAQAAEEYNKAAKKGAVDERLGQVSDVERRLQDALAAARELDEQIASELLTIEVRALPGDHFSRLKRKFPVPEKAMPADRAAGFNTEAVALAALPDSGYYVDGDGDEETLDALSEDDVKELRATITDGDFDRIRLAVLNLNSSDGFQGVGHLKAASSVTPASDSK
ncbi:hypothetical protein [Agrococcus sp. Marseille-Q4369]|uniref:hypothetical protein n=1 Tax=Agrococcus sp. Marseille-Q4369 TaxID=2810513 RepID=UPI001B8CCD36|nr:hypothetical protein [Agrococcus sp. Marseille-Q4369]QUW18895.1 hypothetical protein JSQ78_00475 [Agrococcus sp. Marseille-Q4369]